MRIWVHGFGNGSGTGAPAGDPDATAYINEVKAQGGTLSGAEETAINTFYTTLKTENIYSKLYVIYPFLGGTATSNAVEGIAPGGTYDLTFNGAWTHSVSGSSVPKAAGTNYADTSFNPSASADLLNSFSFGVYSIQPIDGTGSGYHGLGNGTSNYILLGSNADRAIYEWWNGGNNQKLSPADWTLGAHVFQSRTANNAVFGGYADSATGDTITTGITLTAAYPAPANLTLWFGSNNGNDIEFGGEMRFGWAGQGFNTTELQSLSTAINDLQTAFSRNVYS